MKYKLVELKEDDPIFRGGFIVSPINIKAQKKQIKTITRRKLLRAKEIKKKGD